MPPKMAINNVKDILFIINGLKHAKPPVCLSYPIGLNLLVTLT